MYAHVEKPKENKRRSVANSVAHKGYNIVGGNNITCEYPQNSTHERFALPAYIKTHLENRREMRWEAVNGGGGVSGLEGKGVLETNTETPIQRAVIASVGKTTYESGGDKHAEERLFKGGKYATGDLTISMNAWPCIGEGFHNCHKLFKEKSKGRTITVKVTGDKAGYAACYGLVPGSTGTIVYEDGGWTIQGKNAIPMEADEPEDVPYSAYTTGELSNDSKEKVERGLKAGRYPPEDDKNGPKKRNQR
ncbi:hypothetical protein MHN79_12895 [Vibrio sp. Of14-4]|uniref:hypothetical protein n=1 Tax=Vibrio sp. Of14-4 TaxID=2724878 RepID=UPI001EF31DC0|nr:hypothetical protein [Vibrio sp. Of14-4]MCG7490387.1 hypothetical protein [Vibrio sp. Of14-4]